MSWLARSIANTLKIDDEDDDDHDHKETNNTSDISKGEGHHLIDDSSSSPTSSSRGVTEDLSELTKTFTRQLWGVASFLAPPPHSEPPSQVSDSNHPNEPRDSDSKGSDPAPISGIRNDFAEIGGRFRSGISKLSSNVAVTEITKMASNFLQLGSEEDDYDSVRGAVGVTEVVVAFVNDITMHPETWLDFPLPVDDDEDFDLSNAQQEHALAVERLAPRLTALRIELCPGYMSENCFWKIYFVLLHPKLDKDDAELLSTAQIVKARASLMQELKNHTKANSEQDWSSNSGTSYSKDITNSPHEESLSVPSTYQTESSPLESATSAVAADFETEKHQVLSTEITIVDKSVIEEGPVEQNKDQSTHSGWFSNVVEEKDEDDGDDWLKEESSEIVGTNNRITTIPIEDEEDVSFSDLEDDDGDFLQVKRK